MTLAEINRLAFTTLIDKLGYVDAIRFFKQFESGSGDYSQDRHQWLDDLGLDEIWSDIRQRQAE